MLEISGSAKSLHTLHLCFISATPESSTEMLAEFHVSDEDTTKTPYKAFFTLEIWNINILINMLKQCCSDSGDFSINVPHASVRHACERDRKGQSPHSIISDYVGLSGL